ncbi:MAG TPA: hypothetical protein VMR65_01635 [Candidatus Sulfotelmatobacter sp.]|nr:hypothetical protein [Candidatus Sulfotelmatobacter sp.]
MPASAPTIPERCLSREDLDRLPHETIVAGRGGKADVSVVRTASGEVVVKDFSRRGFWGRVAGRVQIRRESRAYRWLAGAPGVPRFLGRIDPWALALERLPARQLLHVPLSPQDGPRLLAKLRSILDGIHARGVVHNDLRGRENLLLLENGELAVIDFAGALRLAPGGIAHRLLFGALRTTDEAAFLKWKGILAPGTYDPSEIAFLERFERRRALWPFNPKRRRTPEGPS